MADKIKVAIYGASGYAGYELYKTLRRHKHVEITHITADSSAGKLLSEVFPTTDEIRIARVDEVDLSKVDALFLSLPHGAAKSVVEKSAGYPDLKIIDLSADYRFDDADEYEKWYGQKHTSPDFLDDFVYGLTEINRSLIAKSRFVANPGCYPTATILGLYPLLREGLLDLSDPIIIDAKSGVTGAGRKAEVRLMFPEVNENVSPYNIGYAHRHTGEIEQELVKIASSQKGPADIKGKLKIIFSPHLVPITRGMLNTMYVKLSVDVHSSELTRLFQAAYDGEIFIRVMKGAGFSSMLHSTNTNLCVISVKRVENSDHAIIVSSIDNLGKGAAGQAIQNFNVMYGLEESEALI